MVGIGFIPSNKSEALEKVRQRNKSERKMIYFEFAKSFSRLLILTSVDLTEKFGHTEKKFIYYIC